MSSRSHANSIFVGVGLLLATWAFTYLPNVGRFPFHRDDWYYILDALNAGPGVFRIMFWIDRPARGVLFQNLFGILGPNPVAYNLSSVTLRLMSGLAALWLFKLLWPEKPRFALWATLLYLVYPGYLRMGAGIESHPHLLSAFLQVASIALTLQALVSRSWPWRIGLWAGAVVSGWGYLLLVEYALGMEFFRILAVLVVVCRERGDYLSRRSWLQTLRAWSSFAVIPVGFLLWRLLLFDNVRPATDLGLQLGHFLETPLVKGQWWLVNLFEGVLNAGFLAWGVPLYRTFVAQGLPVIRIGLLLIAAVIGAIVLSEHALERTGRKVPADEGELDRVDSTWAKGAVSVGLAGLAAGVLPVIIANRRITFEAYSHYPLPASLAAATLIAGLLGLISSKRVRLALLMGLVAIGTLTQFTVTTIAATEAKTIREFWWQVVWRAPEIRPKTTLFVDYGSFSYIEDTSTVWGPANLIYGQRGSGSIPVEYDISALPVLPDRIRKILAGAETERYFYRTHTMYDRFGNVLVMSQPSENACVHVLDGRWPRVSAQDRLEIAMVAPHSKGDNVVTDAPQAEPPRRILGPEPAHEWCYFYQKAELAFQSEDWEQVKDLAEEAARLGFRPRDPIEWMPFLQAYAILGEERLLRESAQEITEDPLLRSQACRTFRSMEESDAGMSNRMARLVSVLFCE